MTTALTIPDLSRLIRDTTARAWEPVAHRLSGETDDVLLGKLTMLDVIGDMLFTSDRTLDPAEEREFQAAKDALGRGWDHLSRKSLAPRRRTSKRTASPLPA
ncbi:hypothetical protein OJ996_20455 [Luteolibacter sp. GHJ8]|uniref:MazG-like nucleotide pyrophosphohydrolase family protein n=1 Tax=Luteolibacter rhizosphaerae TaxID=2989719 RepID=A0ABT3G7Y6_9BACT|nr:hypothetical protein [Luteolibacter rhizosphaerae]MCW1915971.1 hypothetical protein [Luteolibacter rhizosphaerae]